MLLKMVQESIPCEICGTFNLFPFLSTSGYDVEYDLVKCNDCGLVFMNPRPPSDKIRVYYEEEYFEQQLGSKKPTKIYLKKNTSLDKQRLKFVLEHIKIKNKKILDVGCGCGTFLKLLKDNGTKGFGIEPNTEFANYAKKNYHVELQNIHFDDFNTRKKYDIICLWQVLNMVPNPSFLLAKLKKCLKKDGMIFLEIPNYLDAPKIPWKKRVYPSDPGQFFYFNKNTISKLLEKHQLSVVQIKYIKNRSWIITSAKNV